MVESLVERLYDGTYLTPEAEIAEGQIAKFERTFRFVDGVRYPLSLVHPDIEESR